MPACKTITAAVALCAIAAAQPLAARDRDDRSGDRDAAVEHAQREGCVLRQVIAPSFNNNAASMEQMRIASVHVRKAANRHGDRMAPICGSQHDPRALDGEMTMGAPEPVPADDADAPPPEAAERAEG
ncbi:hypothetical protein [Croceicoccus naphthovorans]|uniref:Uncharacterized protein n=1 Tax=Croceicoccus naphthovorans TaxID=1348774 RepID=A0A0G3XJC6_9SPHN|nr:hypothetical protein [Croceicoccus naphthovorans]AKM10483.1 hypothetical protein AB433_11735 [Croceicoccus naphthovorans]MBB3988659.1 hypothetical protein [Croceicoccus naphthovorans]